MKYFAFFLAIYTMYLVSAPCVDENFPATNQATGQTTSQGPVSHADHGDACSPFCICSCCSVPVTIAPDIHVGQPYFQFQRYILPVSSLVISFFSVFFWQPPE